MLFLTTLILKFELGKTKIITDRRRSVEQKYTSHNYVTPFVSNDGRKLFILFKYVMLYRI